MSTRQKTTFQKRQKEMKRQEKQRMKADRRAQRSEVTCLEGGVDSHDPRLFCALFSASVHSVSSPETGPAKIHLR